MLTKLWYRLLRFGFRLLYNEMAWTYDFVSWSVSLGHWRRWQQASINLLAPESKQGLVLELAHGTANLQIDLAVAGVSSVGLDFSRFMGTIARRKLTDLKLPVKLIRASGLNLPFAHETFSAAISTFPTEFIFHEDTIRETFQVLRRGGQFIVIMSGSLAPANVIAKFIAWLYQVTGQTMSVSEKYTTPFHNAGFEARIELIPIGSDTVVAIVAQKPSGNDK